jgi:small-conductance mechanosensitive channel
VTDQTPDTFRHVQSEIWIARLTLILGCVAAGPVYLFYSWRWGTGVIFGAILGWLNFRWLRRGLDALTNAAVAQSSYARVEVPMGTYFRALFRYLLIGVAVYVIFVFLNVPVLSMVFGLCALGAATLVVSVYEILHPPD